LRVLRGDVKCPKGIRGIHNASCLA
jgi:hypothetical protein